MKRQLVVATSLALLVFAASPSFAVNGNIGIYADQGQAICAADLGLQTTMTLYVYALQQGGSLGGITSAEYQISKSAATDWVYSEDIDEPGHNPYDERVGKQRAIEMFRGQLVCGDRALRAAEALVHSLDERRIVQDHAAIRHERFELIVGGA